MVNWEETWDVEVYIYHEAIKLVTTKSVEQKDLSIQSWKVKHSKSLLTVSTQWWTTIFKKLHSLQDLHPILRNNSHEWYWIERKLKMWRVYIYHEAIKIVTAQSVHSKVWPGNHGNETLKITVSLSNSSWWPHSIQQPDLRNIIH